MLNYRNFNLSRENKFSSTFNDGMNLFNYTNKKVQKERKKKNGEKWREEDRVVGWSGGGMIIL